MVWLLTYNTLSAQNQLISAEYYFGTTDPGQGLASPLTVSDGAFDETVESIFSNSVLIALADSNFILNVRVKDQNGLWGPVFTKAMHWSPLIAGIASSISVLQMNDMHITAGEYFLGMSDPGDGNATPILALDGNLNEAVESLFRSNMVWNNLPSPTLFNIRVRDINGVWGPLFKKAIMPSGTRVSANLIAQGDTLHICENLAITLTYAGPNGFSKQWFNNATADSISFVPSQTGYYTLSAQQGNELYTDSIYVIIHPIAASIISADTLRICASSYTLQADTGSYTYLWNTGAINTTTLAITQSGWYTCTYANISCSRIDSVYISLLNAQIQQNDTTICPGSAISLSAMNTVNSLSFFYSSGFDGSTVSSWSNVKRFSFDGSQVMGPYSNELVSYQSSNLPTHDSLQIEFDFYPHDTWDNGEPFQFVLDGNVLSTAYFYYYNGTVSDARFQSVGTVNNRCTNWYPYYTKKYHATFRVPHTQATTQFYINQWSGEDVCNESWSFDNFKISYRAPMQYTWSTGATGAQTSVSPSAQTMYTVTLTDGVGFCTDSVQVSIDTFTAHLFTADTLLNCLPNQVLHAGNGYASYLWGNGGTNEETAITQSGFYTCRVSDGLCYSSDTTYMSYPGIDIVSANTEICAGDGLTLQVQSPGLMNVSNKVIPSGQTYYADSVRTVITGNNLAGSTQVQVQQATGLQQGDAVLLVVMQDNSGNGYNNIGYYEVHKILSVASNIIVLDSTLQYTYSNQNGMRCQLIRIPMFKNLTVEGTVTCHAWDGQTGGVLCLSSRDTLRIINGGVVEANGKGYRGGQGVNSGGGYQGESIFGNGTRYYTANTGGGGGGNSEPYTHGQGGGGGGFAANGSVGSQYNWYAYYWCYWYWCACSYGWCNYNYSGYGGNTLSLPQNRLVLGSGGGSGGVYTYNPYNPYGGFGGSGGGGIMLFADTITGNGAIQSKGQHGDDANNYGNNGGGGAGSGGQITTQGLSSTIGLNVSGGNGGRLGNYVCQGGSGSAGRTTTVQNISLFSTNLQASWSTGSTDFSIWVNPSNDSTYTCSLTDGINTCYDTINVLVHSVPGNFIAADTIRICGNAQVLDAGAGYVSYLWSTGATTQTIQANQTGMYSCTVSNAHCASTDSVFVSLVSMAVLTNDTTICTGTSLQLAAANNSSYQTMSWSSGGSAQTEWVTPSQNTLYYCTASDVYQTCTDSVLVNVSMPVTQLQATPSTTLCANDSLRLNGSGALSYAWSNGVQDGIKFVPTATTTYTVTGSDVFGCSSTQTITVVVNPRPNVGVVSTNTLFCYGVSTVLNASGATSYTWLPSTGLNASNLSSVTATPLQSTTYTVTGTNSYGCTSTADIALTVKPQPIVTPIGNQNYCNGQSVSAVVLSGSPANVSFNISGGASRGMPNQTNVFGLPAFTAGPTGSALVTILPKANGCVGNAYTYTMNVTNCSPVTLNAKFYLQGYYIGSGLMERVLYNQGAIGSASIPNCDYVVVELHATTPPYGVVKTSSATLKTNGTLQCSFQGSVTNNSYYIVINHRNTILTWSSQPVTMSAITNYDFSTASSKAYGNNQVLLEPGIWGFYSADINQDENIDLLDMSLLDIDNMNFEYGYLATDINGDGNVDLLDYPITDLNISNFVYSVHP